MNEPSGSPTGHDVLLREIAHRVRNNMQVVVSFINLVARHSDERARLDLERLSKRVRALGAIQQEAQLDATTVDLGDFLRQMAPAFTGIVSHAAHLSVAGSGASIDAGEATTIGLLVFELLLEASEQEAHGDSPKAVEIAIEPGDGETLVRIVRQGCKDAPPDRSSAGRRLLQHYGRRLHGELTLEADGASPHAVLRLSRD
jgi:two-component sensor histidine kinase